MYKEFTLIAFVLLVFNAACFAQNNFKEGYIIDAKGDTIRGQVDDRGDYRNSQLATFKASSDAQESKFLPTDIGSYKVGPKTYYATSIDDNGQPLPVFLELINDGSLRLFYWNDKADKVHFFVQKNDNTYELTNEQREVQQEGKTYRMFSRAYISLLNILTEDCGLSASGNLAFSLKAISNYVAKYNACKGDKAYVSDKPSHKALIKKSVYAGTNLSQVKTTGDARFKETNTKAGLSAGFGLHVNFPGINDKLYFDLLADYNQKGAEAEKEQINFNLHYINLAPGASYVYPKGKFRPVLGAGFVVGYLLNPASAYIRYKDGQETRLFYNPPSVDNEVKYEFGYEVRGGIKYELAPNKFLLLKVKYSATLIPFNFITNSYRNKMLSFQTGIEF